MEKIQSAIAKAREARTGAQQGAQPAPHPVLQAAAIPDALPGALGVPAAAQPPGALLEAPSAISPEPSPEPSLADLEALWAALPALRVQQRHLAAHRVLTVEGGEGLTEFDVIRTRLLQQLRARGWRRVAVTSPGPHCGKTTVALNLGFGLGQQRDQRTVVAETDFRRPGIAQALGIAERHRFSKVLDGEAPFAENALRHGRNLILATDRGGLRNPADLLQSEQAARVLDAIEEAYRPTVMLFDLPPMLVNDDAMAFLGRVDCALIVAAAESTTIKEIDACERALAAQTNVLGVILNKCRYAAPGDRYGEYR